MQEASFSLAEAKFAAGGDFNQAVLQNVNKVGIVYCIFLIWGLESDRQTDLDCITSTQKIRQTNIDIGHICHDLSMAGVRPHDKIVIVGFVYNLRELCSIHTS